MRPCAYQTAQAEKAFEENLTSLAVSSRSMMHADAEEYCQARGMTFHRVLKGQFAKDPAAEAFERESLSQFGSHPALDYRVGRFTNASGEPSIYVLSPGRLKESCINCHNSYGLDEFKGQKEGDLVASFGDGHVFHIPGLGVTMADGGEELGKDKEER